MVSLAVAGASGIISLLVFVGLILFFIAMHGFSKDYSETRIFDNILYGLIITIVLGLIAVVFAVALFIANASNLIPIITSTPASQTQISSAAQKTALPLLPVFAVVGLVWIVFNVRSLNLLGDKSKVPLFRTGAKVLLAGAALSVAITTVIAATATTLSLSYGTTLSILSVPGGFIQDAAWLILAMAFFRIQAPPAAAMAPAYVPSVPVVSGQTKYCSKCGAPNRPDAVFCERCGQKMQM